MEQPTRVLSRIGQLVLYMIIQIITRGGDWAIQNSIIYHFDSRLVFLPAVTVGALFNISAGYLLLRIVPAFPTDAELQARMPKRFTTFVIVRGLFGATAFIILSSLYVLWPAQYWAYSLFITILMWLLSYPMQKIVFTGHVRQLPRVVRRIRFHVFRLGAYVTQLRQHLRSTYYPKVHT